MNLLNKAYFRFEASPAIGAGHAVRSCVLADALREAGWECCLVTSQETYDFIPRLSRFEKIDPEVFYTRPSEHALLVVDHYGLDIAYAQDFRPYAKKILVIDDLANRTHGCDILLDQTYGRSPEDYQGLVPEACILLVGSRYVLLRKEIVLLRPKALEKRSTHKEPTRILISMGGGNSEHYTLQALEMVKAENFKGALDVVLGFQAHGKRAVLAALEAMPNVHQIHVNPDMAQLMYDADVAIGAAGSSVWERCCLGLPQVLLQTADNQAKILDYFGSYTLHDVLKKDIDRQNAFSGCVDGLGVGRVLGVIQEHRDSQRKRIGLKKMKNEDGDWVYACQKIPGLRTFCMNLRIPSYDEHTQWFKNTLQDPLCVFEKVICEEDPCGVLRLNYQAEYGRYLLSWYVLPQFQNRGIGGIVLHLAQSLVTQKIAAFVLSENIASHKALKKAGFRLRSEEKNGVWYEY